MAMSFETTSAAKGAARRAQSYGDDRIKAMAEAVRRGELAFIEDMETIEVVRNQRKNPEWKIYRKHIKDVDMRLQLEMGFCLRQLEGKPQKLKDLREKILSKYGSKGLDLAELVQHGGFGRYIRLLVRNKTGKHGDAPGCERCGVCCMIYGVSVTTADILRIAQATGKKPSEFLAALPENPEMKRKESVVMIGGKRSMAVLKWSRGFLCPFYTGKGCAIYDARPMVCRMYPFTVKDGKVVDVESRACPSCWKLQDEAAYTAQYKKSKAESMAYAKMVAEWNRGPGGSLDEFIDFALKRAKEAKF